MIVGENCSFCLYDIDEMEEADSKSDCDLIEEALNGHGLISEMAWEAIVKRHTPMVRMLASRYSMNSFMEFEDAFSVGLMGLMEAVRHYDPNRDAKFSTYLYSRIGWSISRYYSKLKRQNCIGRPISLNLKVHLLGDTETELINALIDKNNEIDNLFNKGGLSSSMKRAINKLTKEERTYVVLRYLSRNPNLSVFDTAIAKRMGVSDYKVSTIRNRALRKLKSFLIMERMKKGLA